MSDNMNIDQVLAQMRVMSAQAANRSAQASESAGNDFGELLKQSIDHVNSAQKEASV
ncbi:MAG: flagellar hook-basal body complex protein FliE, partial [Candidatus Thiodiazotropha sp.]